MDIGIGYARQRANLSHENLRMRQCGMSLVELMIALFVASILLTSTVPAFTEMLDQYRLKAATETLFLSLQHARSEAIKRNQRIRLTFNTDDAGARWCYGLKVDAACDCTEAGSCQIDGRERIIHSDDFPGVSIELHISSPGDHFTLENIRWITAGTFGNVRFLLPGEKQTRVIVSRMARTRTCSPTGDVHVAGYSTAC